MERKGWEWVQPSALAEDLISGDMSTHTYPWMA